ncbi:MAG: ACT domain-containing protein [Chloroflexi bacterium]|nr:ACT domain-containing protein [Chloroflexota bacterium]
MIGETDLSRLIKGMKPELNEGEYVYCLADTKAQAVVLDPLCYFLEKEGVTVVLPREKADTLKIPYSTICAWITLTVHSSLEAVGLTAAVAKSLTEANISCNVVAAFYHDHIFVPVKDAKRALRVLKELTGTENG